MENAGTPQNPYINAMCDDNGFTQYGMSLRDYFAAKAMQAIASNVVTSQGAVQSCEYIAQGAYLIADAMLKERDNETV